VLSTPRPLTDAEFETTSGSTTVKVEPAKATHIFSSCAVPGATTTKNLPVGQVDGEVLNTKDVCVEDDTPEESNTACCAAPLYDLRILLDINISYS
jgi:hypothetical protein